MLVVLILLLAPGPSQSSHLSTNGLVGEIRVGAGQLETALSNVSFGGEGALMVGAWSSNTDLVVAVLDDVLIHFSEGKYLKVNKCTDNLGNLPNADIETGPIELVVAVVADVDSLSFFDSNVEANRSLIVSLLSVLVVASGSVWVDNKVKPWDSSWHIAVMIELDDSMLFGIA